MMMHKRNPGRKGKVHVLERERQFVRGELQPAALTIEKEEHWGLWQSMHECTGERQRQKQLGQINWNSFGWPKVLSA